MQHDPNRIEDVLKVDATEDDPDSGDDAYDMLRYALMSRPFETPKLRATHPIGSKEYEKQIQDEMFENILNKKNEKKMNDFLLFGEE